MRGVKCGLSEIDLLALRQTEKGLERWHIEVQTSFRPIGYIGGNTNARKRSTVETHEGIKQWVDKKFKDARKSERRTEIASGSDWKFVLVHANVRHPEELEHLKAFDIKLVSYRQVLNDLMKGKSNTSSSIASDIVDILSFVRSNDGQSPPLILGGNE